MRFLIPFIPALLLGGILASCDEGYDNLKGTLKVNVPGSKTYTANYVNSPIPSSPNTFTFQSTNRAMIFAYFDTNNDATLDIWPANKIGTDIIINKKYTSSGDWQSNEDDFELGCYLNGSDLSYDYAEIIFTKYSIPGQIKATFLAKEGFTVVLTGEMDFVIK